MLGYLVIVNTAYLGMTVLGFWAVTRSRYFAASYTLEDMPSSTIGPPVTLIVPAYNEEATCVESIQSFLSIDYDNVEVLVINDGSTDATLKRLIEAYDLHPQPRSSTAELETSRVREIYRSPAHSNLWVVDKDNGGKADALNVGINFCRTTYVAALDADTLLARDGLVRMLRPFLEDESTVAVGGVLRVVNGCRVESGRIRDVSLPREWLAKVQVLEYLRTFLFGRIGWDVLRAMLIISGAFGLFRREAVVDVGGYRTDTVGEDIELIVRMHRYFLESGRSYRVRFLPDPVAWTQVPASYSALVSQRDRWQRGLADTMIRHQKMLLNPRYGRVGFVAYPFFYFLETFGPVFELIGYGAFFAALALGILSTPFTIAFVLIAFVLWFAVSLSAVVVEAFSYRRYEKGRDLAQLLFLPLLDAFGYRHLNTWWRVRGLWSYIRRVDGWGIKQRVGFNTFSSHREN